MPFSIGLGLSYNLIQPELAAGGQFENFRLATRTEVIGLWQSAGIPDINVSGTAANVAPVLALINGFIGQTSSQDSNPEAFGFTADLRTAGSVWRGTLDFEGGTNVYSARTDGSQGVNSAFASFGAWLVRDNTAVAEPDTVATLRLGVLVFLAGSARRSRHAIAVGPFSGIA